MTSLSMKFRNRTVAILFNRKVMCRATFGRATSRATIHPWHAGILSHTLALFPIVDHVLKVDRIGLSHGYMYMYLLEEHQDGLVLRLGTHTTLAEHHD